MLKLIKNATVYNPNYIGVKDILMDSQSIIAIEDNIECEHSFVEQIDAAGQLAVPGFIDSLVHITGGGGEGGFTTRTPEVNLTDLTKAGITTLVGALGTDAVSRTLTNLIAKTKELNELGLSCYFYSGSYHLPATTLTASVQSDIMLIEECIGVGEVAIADHRGSQLSYNELARLASDSRVGGMLSGKGGIVSIHVGDGPENLKLINEVVDNTDIPITQFLPTHMNRNQALFDAGISYVARGGYIDLTTSTTPEFLKEGELKCSQALKQFIDKEADLRHITFSSDGHASLPSFDESGNLAQLEIGKETSLFNEVRDAVLKEGIDLEKALAVITSNPADILKMKRKGRLKVGCDADIVLLNKERLEIESVFSRGRTMILSGEVKCQGKFEQGVTQ